MLNGYNVYVVYIIHFGSFFVIIVTLLFRCVCVVWYNGSLYVCIFFCVHHCVCICVFVDISGVFWAKFCIAVKSFCHHPLQIVSALPHLHCCKYTKHSRTSTLTHMYTSRTSTLTHIHTHAHVLTHIYTHILARVYTRAWHKYTHNSHTHVYTRTHTRTCSRTLTNLGKRSCAQTNTHPN